MIVLLITISVISAAFSGIAKAICDLSEEGKLKGNPLFWYKNVAWKNKWKDGDKSKGERFFGSSRWFVSLWFCIQSILWYCILGYWLTCDI